MLVGVAAVAMDAEAARLHAQVLMTRAADAAFAAADPGIDENHFADFAVLDVRPDRDDLARGFVAQRHRQLNAAILQIEPPAGAEIVTALPDVQVGMADAARL